MWYYYSRWITRDDRNTSFYATSFPDSSCWSVYCLFIVANIQCWFIYSYYDLTWVAHKWDKKYKINKMYINVCIYVHYASREMFLHIPIAILIRQITDYSLETYSSEVYYNINILEWDLLTQCRKSSVIIK
jgi:hypothetical protein